MEYPEAVKAGCKPGHGTSCLLHKIFLFTNLSSKTGLPHKLKSYGISGQMFGLVSSFLSNRRLRVVVLVGSLHKNIQLILEFLKAPFLVLPFCYYTLRTFLMLSLKLISMLMILPAGKYWSPGRPPPMSPGRPLKILFDRPGDVLK